MHFGFSRLIGESRENSCKNYSTTSIESRCITKYQQCKSSKERNELKEN
ncbi:MAG: hypothetical protein MUO21_03485 [Nitrososphaeraceae archaeon]|nr:hypothetical protein [Nitrososphaeraceae archaeon]